MQIEPGTSIGNVNFGGSIAEVEAMLGKPASIRTDSEWRFGEYGNSEVAATYFHLGKLNSVIVVPTEQTTLWGKKVFRMPALEIEQLLESHGHARVRVPAPHPAIRNRIDAPTAFLSFYLENDICDTISVAGAHSAEVGS